MAHTALVKSVFQLSVVFGRDQVRDGFTEVPEKTIAGLGAFDDSARQYRQPWCRIVAAKRFELRHHIVSPVLRSGFPAVIDHILNAFLAHLIRTNCFLVAIEVFFEIIFYETAIKLVHFKSRCLRRRWVIGDSHQRVADAKNDPVALCRSPVKGPV